MMSKGKGWVIIRLLCLALSSALVIICLLIIAEWLSWNG